MMKSISMVQKLVCMTIHEAVLTVPSGDGQERGGERGHENKRRD